MTNDPHPSPSLLEAFDRGKLDPGQWAAIADHLRTCATCARSLEALPDHSLNDFVRELLREAGTPLPDSRHTATDPAPPGAAAIPADLIGHPRYDVLGPLGAGGMGQVYLARHRLMDRLVALKVLHLSLLSDPAAIERFRQEVRAAARLVHPNIVTAFDADQAGGRHFLVMEHVAGNTLERVIVGQGPAPVAQTVAWVLQVARGLQHAHQHGMVHRDLKPGNL